DAEVKELYNFENFFHHRDELEEEENLAAFYQSAMLTNTVPFSNCTSELERIQLYMHRVNAEFKKCIDDYHALNLKLNGDQNPVGYGSFLRHLKDKNDRDPNKKKRKSKQF